jgi:hypothetical protein
MERVVAETKKQLEDAKADASNKNVLINDLQLCIDRLKVFDCSNLRNLRKTLPKKTLLLLKI